MSIRIIQDRLNQYRPENQLEEENSLKEITQEVALAGLSRVGFFKLAAFQGGTSLRILYGLNRFSEDLDFSLNKPSSHFNWNPFLIGLQTELKAYGYQLQIQDRSSIENPVKMGFLKDDSIGKILELRHKSTSTAKSIKIKLEIDTNPPAGALTEQKYIDFPLTVPVVAHDPTSLFAGKCHALLCRPWEKGRDWYDFLWYVSRKTQLNYTLLRNALQQMGPRKGKKQKLDKKFFLELLEQKIKITNWTKQKQDVARFLKASDSDLLNLWNTDFFLNRLQIIKDYLN